MRRPLFRDDVPMPFVERDQKIQARATQASAKPLAHHIRLRRPRRRAQNPNTDVRHCLFQFFGEDAGPGRGSGTVRNSHRVALPETAAMSSQCWDERSRCDGEFSVFHDHEYLQRTELTVTTAQKSHATIVVA
jgi:hypothetical protein